MNRVFKIMQGFRVPDGTIVYPFLNSKDSQSDLPWELTKEFSIAAGNLEPKTASKIQVHPIVTLVIWVVYGQLQVRMKDPESVASYALDIGPEEAAFARPGTFLQLINPTDSPCRVLYIVGPPYIFDIERDGTVRYEDAVMVDYDWERLAAQAWKPSELTQRLDADWMRLAREKALLRIQSRKQKPTLPDDKSG